MTTSYEVAMLPIGLAGNDGIMKVWIVDTNTPFLVSSLTNTPHPCLRERFTSTEAAIDKLAASCIRKVASNKGGKGIMREPLSGEVEFCASSTMRLMSIILSDNV